MKSPENLSIKLPPDIADLLHYTAFDTGRSKRDLVLAAIKLTYAGRVGSTAALRVEDSQ